MKDKENLCTLLEDMILDNGLIEAHEKVRLVKKGFGRRRSRDRDVDVQGIDDERVDFPYFDFLLQESNVFENGERSIASRNKFEGELQ